MKWKDRSILARFRCGIETKAREYWKEEGEKRCKLCKRNEKDLKHVLEKCEITGGSKSLGIVLSETGEVLAELKVVMRRGRQQTRRTHSKETKGQSRKNSSHQW